MATVVIMPKQGQSVETCAIVGWKKKVGDAVRLGEVICEVETDKATFEVESTAEGTLLAIFHEAGSEVPVLAPIAAIGKPGESVQGLDTAAPCRAAPVLRRLMLLLPLRHRQPLPRPRRHKAPRHGAPAAAPAAQPGGKPAASPRAKALAASRGITLDGIKGSGPGGRIIERDVEAAAAQGQPLTRAALAAAAGGAAPARGYWHRRPGHRGGHRRAAPGGPPRASGRSARRGSSAPGPGQGHRDQGDRRSKDHRRADARLAADHRAAHDELLGRRARPAGHAAALQGKPRVTWPARGDDQRHAALRSLARPRGAQGPERALPGRHDPPVRRRAPRLRDRHPARAHGARDPRCERAGPSLDLRGGAAAHRRLPPGRDQAGRAFGRRPSR